MTNISDYVMQHNEPIENETDAKIRSFCQRAEKHQAESKRLLGVGDQRQAEMHANISRKHSQSAAELKTAPSPH